MKIFDPNTKKLDDRSKPVVHLGVEPESKAYRLYDPHAGKLHVSRDVGFEENIALDGRAKPREHQEQPHSPQVAADGTAGIPSSPSEAGTGDTNDVPDTVDTVISTPASAAAIAGTSTDVFAPCRMFMPKKVFAPLYV